MEKIPELRTKAKKLRQLLRQVESVPGVGNVGERDRDARRKRESRAAAKTVVVPACEDRARRERLEADDEAWLRYYFAREIAPHWRLAHARNRDSLKIPRFVKFPAAWLPSISV